MSVSSPALLDSDNADSAALQQFAGDGGAALVEPVVNEDSTAPAKRPRGRPKKTQPPLQSDAPDTAGDGDGDAGDDSAAPAKRPRGRPKQLADDGGTSTGKSRRGRPKKTLVDAPDDATDAGNALKYLSPFQDESKSYYASGDLVWGKVRSHPWWPGQVIPPDVASEAAASTPHKEGTLLIAYFGDFTYAWNEPSSLSPYVSSFPKMLRQPQHGADRFRAAVTASLDEVYRRVGFCFGKEDGAGDKEIVNAGVKNGTKVQSLDQGFVIDAFSPEKFVEFVTDVAVSSEGREVGKLEVVIAGAQLKGFNRWRGFLNVADLVDGGDMEDENEATPVHRKVRKPTAVDVPSDGNGGSKKKRGRKRKVKTEHPDVDSEDASSNSKNDGDDGGNGEDAATVGTSGKGRRNIHKKSMSDSSNKEQEPGMQSSSVQTDSKRRSRGRPRKNSGTTGSHLKFVDVTNKRSRGRPRKDSGTSGPHLKFVDAGKNLDKDRKQRGQPKKGLSSGDLSALAVDASGYSAEEMLSLLCAAAEDPLGEHSVLLLLLSFFAKYKDYLVPFPLEDAELLTKLKSMNSSAISIKDEPSGIRSAHSFLLGDYIVSQAKHVSRCGEERKTQARRGRKKKIPSHDDGDDDSSSWDDPPSIVDAPSSGPTRKIAVRKKASESCWRNGGDEDSQKEPQSTGSKSGNNSEQREGNESLAENGSEVESAKCAREKEEIYDVEHSNEPRPPVEALNVEQVIANAELLDNCDEKPDDCMATTLTPVLSNQDAVPSEHDLVNFFEF